MYRTLKNELQLSLRRMLTAQMYFAVSHNMNLYKYMI